MLLPAAGGLRLGESLARPWWAIELACQGVQGRTAVRGNARAVGEQLAGVFEDDDAVAQEAPSLLWEGSYDFGRVMVDGVSRGARGLVLAHCWFLRLFG